MPVYTIRFRTDGGELHTITEIDCETDAAAVSASAHLDVPSIANGFELWHGERLVAAFPRGRRDDKRRTDK